MDVMKGQAIPNPNILTVVDWLWKMGFDRFIGDRSDDVSCG